MFVALIGEGSEKERQHRDAVVIQSVDRGRMTESMTFGDG